MSVKKLCLGWRDDSVVKSTDCFSESPEFKSQKPHGGSQPSIMKTDASSGASEDSYSYSVLRCKKIVSRRKHAYSSHAFEKLINSNTRQMTTSVF